MSEQLRIILIIIVSVSLFGLIVFIFVKNYIKNKINNLIKNILKQIKLIKKKGLDLLEMKIIGNYFIKKIWEY